MVKKCTAISILLAVLTAMPLAATEPRRAVRDAGVTKGGGVVARVVRVVKRVVRLDDPFWPTIPPGGGKP